MQNTQLRAVLAAVRAGSEGAFDQLYDALSTPVYTIALRITGSRTAAEDLTQEVFLRLWQSPPDEAVRNPRAFIFQTVHNLAVDHLRKQHTEPLPDTLADPCDPIGDMLLRETLRRAMLTLTPEERETVSLHIDAELRFHEIAALTGCSLSSVYRTYTRALKKLRTALQTDERSDEI